MDTIDHAVMPGEHHQDHIGKGGIASQDVGNLIASHLGQANVE